MRFLHFLALPGRYLKQWYRADEGRASRSFGEQLRELLNDGVSAPHYMGPALAARGHEVFSTVMDCEPLQRAWAREHGMVEGCSLDEIAVAQVNAFAPDVLYLSHTIDGWDSRFIRRLQQRPPVVVGWRAATIQAGTDYSLFNLMLTSDPVTESRLPLFGARRVERFYPGFPTERADEYGAPGSGVDLSFVGQITNEHNLRKTLLTSIARWQVRREAPMSLQYWIPDPDPLLPVGIHMHVAGECFGRRMYEVFRTSRISLNVVADFVKGAAGNMRQFEVVGSGGFLLTQADESLEAHFVQGKEVAVYADEADLLAKIEHFLTHEDERQRIVEAGYARACRDHSLAVRAEYFERLVGAKAPTMISLERSIELINAGRATEIVTLTEAINTGEGRYAHGLALLALGRLEEGYISLRSAANQLPHREDLRELVLALSREDVAGRPDLG